MVTHMSNKKKDTSNGYKPETTIMHRPGGLLYPSPLCEVTL